MRQWSYSIDMRNTVVSSTVDAAYVGAKVRDEMTRQGITQMQVAAALGIGQPAVSSRLSGRVALDVGELPIIAALLGVPVSTLMGDAS